MTLIDSLNLKKNDKTFDGYGTENTKSIYFTNRKTI